MKKKDTYLLWTMLMALAVSGLVYWYYKKVFVADDPFSIAQPPLQSLMMKAHLVIAPLFVFFFGWIGKSHVKPRYKSQNPSGRKSGIVNFLLLTACCLSGYYLQVIVSQRVSTLTSWLHVISGLVVVAVLIVHRKAV